MDTTETPLKIAIVLGSTRPGRRAETVARWVRDSANGQDNARFELVDLAEYRLPLLDEPAPAITGDYLRPHTRAWSERVAGFDGFLFVTPEYNRSIPAVLKNAIDYLYAEWGDKVAGIVSYGVDAGGARAGEHLRQVLGELHVAGVRDTVALSLRDDFGGPGADDCIPRDYQRQKLDQMLRRLLAWGQGMREVRAVGAAR